VLGAGLRRFEVGACHALVPRVRASVRLVLVRDPLEAVQEALGSTGACRLHSWVVGLSLMMPFGSLQEEQKPKNERRPIPKTPPGIGEGGGGMTRQEIEALNQAAQEAYNVHGMETCEFCGRTFAEGRLAIHNKSCRADSVAKKIDDGAAPRNKKGESSLLLEKLLRSHRHYLATEPEVDYGRARPSTRPRLDSSSSQSSLQSDAGGTSGESVPSRPTTSTSGAGARPLAGSLASNRKKAAGQEGGAASRQHIQSPLEQSVDATSLTKELQGKGSMVSTIQAKLDRWEATTVATLQEIRDLKEVFAQLNAA
jgi:hypothetical protein